MVKWSKTETYTHTRWRHSQIKKRVERERTTERGAVRVRSFRELTFRKQKVFQKETFDDAVM